MSVRLVTLVLLMACGGFSAAQEPEIDQAQLPRIPATEPEDVLDTFEIRPGFKLKLVAHEPDIVDPIAMTFDADGGMYVIEMRGYSERREDALGRIRYLRDHDNDGLFESSTVFKDDLKWPTGLVCYKGGVFVGASPDLFYFKDTDGDFVS
ncbi:MAG: dehydrogenase, partial [Cyanothece sp. SIO1E1]|nr:dehydrogenase [Cyanothece sp. SIO1E1]